MRITRVVYITFIIAIICTCIARSAFIAHEWQKLHMSIAYMGQFLQDGENYQNVAFFSSALTKRFGFLDLY